MIRILFVCFFITVLSGCGTRAFIDRPAANFQDYSCEVGKEKCGVRYKNGGVIQYDVVEEQEGQYRVEGSVDVDWQSTSAIKFLTFYVIFMDEEKVLYEYRIKTSTKQAFGFEFETEKPILTSTLANIRWMVRS